MGVKALTNSGIIQAKFMSDIDRRQFLRNSAFSAAGLMMGKNVFNQSNSPAENPPSSYNIMEEVEKYRMIDSHAHVYFSEQSPDIQIAFADRLGIDKLVISRPMAREKEEIGRASCRERGARGVVDGTLQKETVSAE